MRYYISILILLFSLDSVAQQSKPVIDTAALNHWIGLGEDKDLRVSPDAKYISYSLELWAHPSQHVSTVLKSTSDDWQLEFKGAKAGYFSADGKQYLIQDKGLLHTIDLVKRTEQSESGIKGFTTQTAINPEWVGWQRKDGSVILRNLLSDKEQIFTNASSFRFDASGRWLVIKSKELTLFELKTGKERKFENVSNYWLSENGNELIIETKQGDGTNALNWVSVDKGQKLFWSNKDPEMKIGNLLFDRNADQLLFTLDKGKDHSCWYYKHGTAMAVVKISNGDPGTEGMLVGGEKFSHSGQYIMFKLTAPADARKVDISKSAVDIWSYSDTVLQSSQLYQIQNRPKVNSYLGSVSLSDGIVRRLQQNYEEGNILPNTDVAMFNEDATGDRFWEEGHKKGSNRLVWPDGRQRMFPNLGWTGAYASPNGRFLVYFDRERGGHYYSYDLQKDREIKITGGLANYSLTMETEFEPKISKTQGGVIMGWLKDNAGLLVHDSYDIWLLDPSGGKAAVCITHGYGRKNGYIFGLSTKNVQLGEEVLLSAYSKQNRFNGFYRLKVGQQGDPEKLFMGPYCLEQGSPSFEMSGDDFDRGMAPLKATASDRWIVKRQSAVEAPNYFVTTDFKSYQPITTLQSQKNYNWLTGELVRFKQSDGTASQGVLYKPENFDPFKKYPVIIHYYRILSHRLYQFPRPDYLRGADVNIPWFTSRGYLVFTPDLYLIREGQQGVSGLNTMEGAALHLSRLPYIDKERIAIMGHSNGGSITTYLVTHSKLFAAAFAGAIPATDWISMYLGVSPKTGVNQAQEKHEKTNGYNLWQRPDLWLKENPILHADRVVAPLLIYHGLGDDIPLAQPLELFLGLRRLNKPVWLLSYGPGGSHVLGGRKNVADLTLRATQFFDHYLKGASAPRWMTEGRPARLKQIEDRFELNSSSKSPN